MPRWDSFASFLSEAQRTDSETQRQALVDDLLTERREWPWVERNRATFVLNKPGTERAALNLDTITTDPPFDPMTNLEGTTLWHVTHNFASDDLLDYMLAVNDPMTPLAQESNILTRVSQYWQADRLNPVQMNTAQMPVSVLRMPYARPFPDWAAMKAVPHGRVYEHSLDSHQLGFQKRKLWVYTPVGYESSGQDYPLLILEDGQWCIGPLQIPAIVDALIKHRRMQPVVIAMIQSAPPTERAKELISNARHYAFLLTELLPFVQTRYRVDSTKLGTGGVASGAIAAANAALLNPAVFHALIMISPPMGKGSNEEQLSKYPERFASANLLPRRIFHSVGRYETKSRFVRPAHALRDTLSARSNLDYKFVEIASGHGLVAFRSIFPEALAWAFPGEAR
ncbi:MAG: esterase family protein [Burkholderiales bacterium]|nr:esterase family protein [Anaerolineae bacterium]